MSRTLTLIFHAAAGFLACISLMKITPQCSDTFTFRLSLDTSVYIGTNSTHFSVYLMTF